jgi:phage terminase large subunit-like protein
VWLILAGRGFGKTRTGAEATRKAKDRYGRIHLVGPTAGDVRDVMVEGQSGILETSPPWDRPQYEPSKRRLTWGNGAVATLFSADEPDRLRGPQCEFAWCDELAAWRYHESWDQLMFGLRLGEDPRCLVTTTPRPTKEIRDLLKQATTHVTRGTTYENRDNLAPAFFEQIVSKYEGTRLGKQELLAEVLDDVPGALWTWDMIQKAQEARSPVEMKRIVVAIDPAVTATEDSDETGIVACGIGTDGRGYVLADESGRYTPNQWGRKAVELYKRLDADRIVAEVNNGGDMVETVIRTVDLHIPYRAVRASRGKRVRAEPVAALYEQGKVSHLGSFSRLEDQMCTWDATTSDKSPDRLDALVWALTDLKLTGRVPAFDPIL